MPHGRVSGADLGVAMRVLAIAALLWLSGCATFTSPARMRSVWFPDRPQWFDYSAERRGGVLVPKNGDGFSSFLLCGEPSPDIAANLTTQLAAEATYAGVTGQASLEQAKTAAQLAGRTQAIVFLRECLYRLCEGYLNGAIRRQEASAIYRAVIVTAAAMADAGQRSAEASARASIANALAAVAAGDITPEVRARAIATLTEMAAPVPQPSAPEAIQQVFEQADQRSDP